jgi:hypothetical protein
MKNLLFILFFVPFLAFGQMSSIVKDSLIVGTVAKDTTLQVFTSKTGSKFLVLWSDKSKKYYRVYLPKKD